MSKSKINLIIFHPYSDIGGADLSLSRLINNLDHKKYEIDFICLNKQKIRKYLKRRIKIHIIKSSKTIFSIFKVRRIIQENLKLNFTKVILFSNQNFVNVISYFITLGLDNRLKKVLIERNHISELFTYFNLSDFFRKIIIRNLMKFTYPKFDRVIGNSEELSRDLGNFLNLKVKTIHNAVIANKSRNIINYKKKGRILNVGRLEKQKDHLTLIKAFNIAIRHRDLTLTIIGNGSDYKDICEIIRKYKINKKIKILKNITNIKPFYKNCDLFISSSLYEGFPNVIAESINMSIPIISSNCKSGIIELLRTDKGPNIFKKGNYEELAKRILNHYKNPLILTKKTINLKKNLQKFSLIKYVKRYNNLFLNL